MGQIKLDPPYRPHLNLHLRPSLLPFFTASPVQSEERESALQGRQACQPGQGSYPGKQETDNRDKW